MTDTKQRQQDNILHFIKRHKIGVVGTASSVGEPEAAVVEFGETDELELIFDTFISSRKYRNLKQNPIAAFVIGWDENITIQYRGKAVELSSNEDKQYKEIYFLKNPRAREWQGKEGITYFKVIPEWIRYSDLNKNPWEVFELTFRNGKVL